MKHKILGIGIDSVDIERFKEWHSYPLKSLRRVFSEHEIEYCLQNSTTSAQRFAARFAAREAFFKALYQVHPNIKISLLAVCSSLEIKKKENGTSHICIDWQKLQINSHNLDSHISWTHTKQLATAIVIIEVGKNNSEYLCL